MSMQRLPVAGRVRSARPGFLKLCVADGDRAPDVRSLAIARETLARHSRPRRFRLRHAGAGLGRDQPVRNASSKSANGCPRSPAARRSRRSRMTEPETRVSDAANIAMTARARRRRLGARRRENLHLQRRHRRFLLTVFARTGEATARAGCPRSSFARDDPGLRSPSASRSSRRTRSPASRYDNVRGRA